MKKISKWSIIGAVGVAALAGGYLYWRHNLNYPSTNDAYVSGHVVRIAPRITGMVASLPVHEFQEVAAGDLLLEIDRQPFEIALQKANAQLDLQRQKIAADQAAVDAAQADVKNRQAEYDDAKTNMRRVSELLAKHSIAKAKADDARYRLDEAKAALGAAQADLQHALKERGAPGERNAELRLAEAEVAQARLDLSYTRIKAVVSGILGEITVRPGTMVQAGQMLFPLLDSKTFWVDANYKETDLHRIHSGQKATIAVDMYPDKTFNGVVESISPASGVAFSLLPPENATGNWVKVTQRFPVRLRITDASPRYPLRIGASSHVTIDTITGGERHE
ncbi:MAG: HlyD family secretion protein [Deltaproteobacteria bacterium]